MRPGTTIEQDLQVNPNNKQRRKIVKEEKLFEKKK
jgi:hypothetical protein